MIVMTDKLALLYFGIFDFYIYDKSLFCLFYKDVLSQALSEDAA